MQHGRPENPHSAHWLVVPVVTQTVVAAVQTWPGQHGRPSVPQESQ